MDFIKYSQQDLLLLLLILVIAIIALIITRKLLKISFPYFFMGFTGLTLGLIIGSLFGNLFSNLPGQYGRWLPIVANIFIAVAIFDLFIAQAKSINLIFRKMFGKLADGQDHINNKIIVDTSVLIDGRLLAIAETGFILGTLLIPSFVLEELQNVADSKDSLKRIRGRRGLEIVSSLQKSRAVEVDISDKFSNGNDEIDSRLIRLAKEIKSKILTVDFNLNRIAQIQGVGVLNINELAESLKPVLIPGENITVKIIQKGKEKGQGVGYLADGTMIVVEGGDKNVNESVECEVVRIFHTLAGKMIFVKPTGVKTAQTYK